VELAEVSDAIMADINSELANGAQILLPYMSWRSHQTALSGAGTEHKIDISESAMNLTNMYSVIMPGVGKVREGLDLGEVIHIIRLNKGLSSVPVPFAWFATRDFSGLRG